jgi:hypothetical protein
MRRAAFAVVGTLEILACVAVASCGIDTSGLAAASDGGGDRKHVTDATAAVDGGGSRGGEGAADALWSDVSDAGADAPVGDVQQQQDGPTLVDVVSEPPPPPTCQGCGATQCCGGNGTCTDIGNASCADPGQPCVDCTMPPGNNTGDQCIMIQGETHYVCGCLGPGSSNQCPLGYSCHSQQCTTSCDFQHPCNGGCCSGHDFATSTCVAGCDGGTMCFMGYCQ